MSYARSVLQPDEHILVMGKPHWIIYDRAFIFLIAGVVFVWAEAIYLHASWTNTAMAATAAIFGGLFLISFLHAWFLRWITEIAVTNKRVIYKTGFIKRHTIEMNMDKVESVDVDQTLLGRLLDYGSIEVHGTGEGIENLDRIGRPLALRNAITAK